MKLQTYILPFLTTLLVFTLSAPSSLAFSTAPQRYKNGVRKKEKKEEKKEDMTRWTQNPICKAIVVDSMVVDDKDIISHIPLPEYLGRLYYNKTIGRIVYENDFQDQRVFSATDSNGNSEIYRQTLLADKWSEPEKVTILGSTYDRQNPFLMPDGMTLVFAARDKEESDFDTDEDTPKESSLCLYTTIYDNETNSFLEPQKLPYPFISDYDDLYYIADETTDVSWLVSKRRQPKGKVCIYTMSVKQPWQFYDSENFEPQQLKSLATLWSIAETCPSEEVRKNILCSVEKIKKSSNGKSEENASFSFVINDNTVYHTLADFSSTEAKDLFLQYAEMKNRLYSLSRQLTEYRRMYKMSQNTNNSKIAETILSIESETEKLQRDSQSIAKKIRIIETQK